jgi:hypothetical protein
MLFCPGSRTARLEAAFLAGLSTLLFQAMNSLVRDAHPSHNEAPSAGMPTSEPGGFVQLTVITPYRQHTISLNALAIAVKADILIEIKTCAWCGDEFVPAARATQFSPLCRV